MLLILEVAMLGAGLYALVTGKVPAFIVGGSRFRVNNTPARGMGLLMMLPIPATFVLTIIAAIFMNASGSADEATLTALGTGIEIMTVVATAILILVLYRVFRQPVVVLDTEGKPVSEPLADVEAQIAQKTNGSLIYVLLGGLGVTALIVCPLAYIRTTQALRMIDQYHVGEQHRSKANTIRALSMVVLVGWLAVGGCFIGSLLLASR